MIGQYRNLGQNADAEADGDRSLNAGDIGAGICHVPRAPRRFGRMDHAAAIEATWLGHDERKRVAAEIDRMPSAGYPMQALGPRCNRIAVAGFALEQCKIKFPTLKGAPGLHADTTTHV